MMTNPIVERAATQTGLDLSGALVLGRETRGGETVLLIRTADGQVRTIPDIPSAQVAQPLPATVAETLLAGDDDDGAPLPAAAAPAAAAPPPQRDWLPGPLLQRMQAAERFGEDVPSIRAAIEETAARVGVHPAALAAMVDVESRFNPRAAHGSYRGATQMGPATFREAGGRLGGVDFDTYQTLPLTAQIRMYPEYLAHYGRLDLVRELATDQPPNIQAAILQGFQFAPNDPMRPEDRSFVAALRSGDFTRPTTPHPQARVLGDTSLGQMSDYFAGVLGDVAPAPTTPRTAPAVVPAPADILPDTGPVVPAARPDAGTGLEFDLDDVVDPAPSGLFPPPAPIVPTTDPTRAPTTDPTRARTTPATDPFVVGDPDATAGDGPQGFGERLMAGLEDLPDALRYLQLMEERPMDVGPPPRIHRPRRSDIGSRALQRMGIASLA